MFALLPATAAVGVLYGSLFDRVAVRGQLSAVSPLLPEGMLDLLVEFLTTVPRGFGLGVGLAINLLIVLWTVQRSASGVITALNVVLDVEETRSRIRRQTTALLIALGGLAVLFVSLVLVAGIPLLVGALQLPAERFVIWLRWPVIGLLFMAALALLYRFAPAHPHRERRWLTWGTVIATFLWLAASGLFSFYISHFGNYSRLYGSVTAVMVLLLWMFISALSVLVGAEVDAQMGGRAENGTGVRAELDKHERAPEDRRQNGSASVPRP